MKSVCKYFSRSRVCAVMTFVFFTTTACNSGPSAKSPEAEKPAAAAKNASGPEIDLNCVPEHLQKPPEAFHYSYRWNGDRHLVQEVDVTEQTIDGTSTSNNGGNGDFTDNIHAVRSDTDAWRIAVGSLNFGIGGLAPGFALVNHSSATVREGTGPVNGYDATKFTIDTSRGDPAAQVLYKNTLGSGGFEKGTVWVTSQGCPVKISLDDEIHGNDGSVTKDHFEEAMIKK